MHQTVTQSTANKHTELNSVSLSHPAPHRHRPGGEETLEAAGAAAAAMLTRAWQPHCCVILLTDGTASTHAVAKGLQQLAAPRGAAVLESGAVKSTLNKTLQYARSVSIAHGAADSELSVITRAADGSDAMLGVLQVRRLAWCVVVVVVSDDPSFFASWAELALESGLLAWSTRLVALTSLPASALNDLYLTLSFANAVLVVSDGDSSPRCELWVHQPFSPPNSRMVQVASWSPFGGLSVASQQTLFPDKFHRQEVTDAHPTFAGRLAWGPTLIVAAEEFQPHVWVEAGAGKGIALRGPMAELLQVLAWQLNFTSISYHITGHTLCDALSCWPWHHGDAPRPCLSVTCCSNGQGITGMPHGLASP
ncbi:hypothetical protein E2C01_065486 [Portunus trituberculatus]|uniref:Uncharacterized protein n=1 Tax=Portunus trituberculatus TaxID=210409 RepID=A0A5B7HRV7_PORTR|nr:hypothetical protein [Portunus trituberculatus]